MADSPFSRITSWFWNLKHPILFLLVTGLILRLLISAMSINYDIDYWALVIRNIEAGEGLYGVEGYYYTPVWGYILGLVAAFQTLFLDMGEVAVRVVDALFMENTTWFYFSATVPSLLFNYSVKIPLIVCDMVLAYLVYYLVKDVTGDERKAILALALTFFSPLLLSSTGLIAMPDTISAMTTVLAVILARKERYFFAGAVLGVSILTKFFPVFLVLVFVAYVMSKHRGDCRVGLRHVFHAGFGALLVMVIVFMPQILEGNIEQCFQFLTDRTGSTDTSLFMIFIGKMRIVAYSLVIILTILLSIKLYRSKSENKDNEFIGICFTVAVACMMYPPTPQYMVLVVPFLAYWAAVMDKRLISCWWVLVFSTLLFMSMTNGALFLSLSEWASFPPIQWIADVFNAYQNVAILGFTVMEVQFFFAGVFQYLAVLLMVILLWFEGMFKGLDWRASRNG